MILPVLLTFIAVFLIVASIFLGVNAIKESPKFTLKMRLRNMVLNKSDINSPSGERRSEILKGTHPFERTFKDFVLFQKLIRSINQAGLKIQLHFFLIFAAAAVFIPSIGVFIFTQRAGYGILTALSVCILIAVILKFKKTDREKKFTEQLPDILMMIARSLRAGHSMNSAIELVGMDTPNPAGELFKTAYEQQKLGVSIIDSLGSMTDSIESLDLRFFITTVNINSEIGGNLAEILDKLAATIRDRGTVRRQVRVFTAQARFSGYILAVLPILMFIMIRILNPEYGNILLKEKLGHYFLFFAFIMQLIGYLFIKKIINIRI